MNLILPKNVSCISINVNLHSFLFFIRGCLTLLVPLYHSPVSQQLLAIVQQKAMMGVVDSTLKFALSALWNLTDEMPTAARNFIECRGLELYEEVLEVQEHPNSH